MKKSEDPSCRQYKIIDLGIAVGFDTTIKGTMQSVQTVGGLHFAGTPAYMAPEMFPGMEAVFGKIGPSVDLWALGVTMFQLMTNQLPFQPDAVCDPTQSSPDIRDKLQDSERASVSHPFCDSLARL